MTKMKETGTRREVLRKTAQKTKKGETYDVLVSIDKKFASIAKRSQSAQNSPWRKHVLDYCKKKKISYSSALSDPNCKKGYVKIVKPQRKTSSPTTVTVIEEEEEEET